MPQFKISKEVYEDCQADGFFKKQEEIDLHKIQNMLIIALTDLEIAQKTSKTLPKEGIAWTTIFKLHYDVFRELVDAFVRFEYVKSTNHKCLVAYLCEKHPELELSWDFLEGLRTKRNGIQYYGTPVTYVEWKHLELQLNIYIKTMRKVVEENINKIKK